MSELMTVIAQIKELENNSDDVKEYIVLKEYLATLTKDVKE